MTEKANQGISAVLRAYSVTRMSMGLNGKRVIVPERKVLGPMVRRLFELCATGRYSIKQLGSVVREERLTGRGDRPMPTSTVHKIVRNRVYSGDFEWGPATVTTEPTIPSCRQTCGNRRKPLLMDG